MNTVTLLQAKVRVRVLPIHFERTFSLQRIGPYDPTAELDQHSFRKAFFYCQEPAAIEIVRSESSLHVTAFGPHAERLADETAHGLQQDDSYAIFSTQDSGVLRLHRLLPGLRLLRVPWLHDMTCSAILQQRIRFVDAMREWRRITARFGVDGPLGLRVFPSAEMLVQIPMFELQRLGMDEQRARTLLRFAQESRFVPFKPRMAFDALRTRLLRIPGIGPWTTETVVGHGAGDTDAAIPGDLHLPHLVCYALAGEPEGSDERMMELLEPFRGHRLRIIRLLYESRLVVPRS